MAQEHSKFKLAMQEAKRKRDYGPGMAIVCSVDLNYCQECGTKQTRTPGRTQSRCNECHRRKNNPTEIDYLEMADSLHWDDPGAVQLCRELLSMEQEMEGDE